MKKIVMYLFVLLAVMQIVAKTDLPDFNKIVANRTKIIQEKITNFPQWQEYLQRDSREMDNYDVTYAKIKLDVDFDDEIIYGDNILGVNTVEEGVNEIIFDFTTNLTVDDVLFEGNSIPFTHENYQITIDLSTNYPINSVLEFNIIYHGHPIEPTRYHTGFIFDSHAGNDLAYTMVEPFGSREWWPCKDVPDDKIDTVDYEITCPEMMLVASNGLLQQNIDNGDGTRTFIWHTDYPISTYLVSLAMTNYQLYTIPYTLDGMDMNIENYLYPETYQAGVDLFSQTPAMIDFLSDRYCTYPFLDEKYGHAIYPGGGAMEHQTCTSFGSSGVNPNGEYTVLHELSHQWTGDMITCRTWSDIWLNEGFATYAEVMWTEHQWGEIGYHQHMNALDLGTAINDKIHRDDSDNGTYILDIVVYYKGAWLLNMLRGMVGTDTMNEILSTYVNDPAVKYGTASSEDFKDVCEDVSGMELDWFFDEWLDNVGRPVYKYTYYKSTENNELAIGIESSGISGEPFDMFVPLTIAENQYTMWVQDGLNHHNYAWDGGNINIVWDEDNWVLDNGYTYKAPEITTLLRNRDGSVSLSWNNFFDTDIEGFYVYRSVDGVNFEQITPVPISSTSYLDEDVESNISYTYKIRAVLYSEGNYISEFSNEITLEAVDFTFDQGILILDGTHDYPENSPFPTDDVVDEFYQTISNGYNVTEWDINQDNLPSLIDLASYSTVIYTVDDIVTIPFHDLEGIFMNYLNAGGKMIFSGWKNENSISEQIQNNVFGVGSITNNENHDFISAYSNEDYPQIDVDPDKVPLPTWDGKITYANKFSLPERAVPILYYDSATDDEEWEGMVCAFRTGNVFVLGFPLYYMNEDQSTELLSRMLEDLGENTSVNSYSLNSARNKVINYPNPFNPSTTILFSVSNKTKPVEITIYNIRGQEIKKYHYDSLTEGQHSLIWNGYDDQGKKVPSGIYLYKFQNGESSTTKKMILMK